MKEVIKGEYYMDVQRLATLHVSVLNAIAELSMLQFYAPSGSAISCNMEAARSSLTDASRYLTWACINNRKKMPEDEVQH